VQPKPAEKKIAGLIEKATISSGFTMHIPKAVQAHWLLEVGDILEFYSPFTDLPQEFSDNYLLVAVVVRKKPKPYENVPVGHPFEPGLKKVEVTK